MPAMESYHIVDGVLTLLDRYYSESSPPTEYVLGHNIFGNSKFIFLADHSFLDSDFLIQDIIVYGDGVVCGGVIGYDPFPYTTMYNGKGIVKGVYNGGCEIHIEMDAMYNVIYPVYLSGGDFAFDDVDVDGVIQITKLYRDDDSINLNSVFKDNGVTATYTSSLTGLVDISPMIKRYGYVNTYKVGRYFLRYEVTYRQKYLSVTRIVNVVEPNWIENTIPPIYLDKDLMYQLASRFSDIYWELNYIVDNSRFNFDSRLLPLPKYTQDFVVPVAEFDGTTDVSSNGILSVEGYVFKSKDEVVFSDSKADLPLGLFTGTEYTGTEDFILGDTVRYNNIWWQSLFGSIGNFNPISPPVDNSEYWKRATFIVKNVINELDWSIGNSYVIGNYIKRFGTTWKCMQNHTSTSDNEPGSDESFWKLGCRIQLGVRSTKGYIKTLNLIASGSTCYIRRYKYQLDSQGYIFELLQ